MDPISPISAGYTSQAASVQPNANIAQSTAGAATAGFRVAYDDGNVD